MARWKEDRL